MAMPSDEERDALADAGPLLRFAAEKVDSLDPDFSLAIAQALEASRNNVWTPEISQRFWHAFNVLCELIKPVTMECLYATHHYVEYRPLLFFWSRPVKRSLAEKTSTRYLVLLCILLIIATPLQLYIWISTNLTQKIDGLLTELAVEVAQLSTEYTSLTTELGPAQNHNWTKEEDAAADKVIADASSLTLDAQRALQYSLLLDEVTTLWADHRQRSIGVSATKGNQYFEEFQAAIDLAGASRIQAFRIERNASLFSGILLSFILPILFGAIGAVAYVIRTVSNQIQNTTFSESSPVRHLMRVMLGALMGVVIGLFSGLSGQLSLPPLALAFLAGYGVEAVFSMFDAMIQKFRQPEAATPLRPL
ncbi:MAG TPA: hypothetical protein VMF53_08790 [Alphaproteobacteria bacterium]|nr:hypothetical protein [Alphaproteobacteria bacterium]